MAAVRRPRPVDGPHPGTDPASEPGEGKQEIQMMADRVLVTQSKDPGERRSRSGILIPATANVAKHLVWGEVVAVGPTVRNVESGDRVLFSPENSYEVDLRGDDYLLVRERDIHAVASSRVEGQTGLYL